MKDEGIAFESFDALYERHRSYEAVVAAIVREVRRAAKGKNVCYCTDGSPAEDRAAQALLQGKGVRMIDGISKASAAAALAGFSSYEAVSAYHAAERALTLPLVVYDLADRSLAADVKLALAEKFGDEATAVFLREGEIKYIKLFEADRQEEYGAACALALPEIPLLEKKRFSLDDLLAILRRLRAPDGCPWDRAQTHRSIRMNAVEEAYELVDAIDSDDPAKMCEEAGDVMMQAAFHTLIEEERRNFGMTDVLSGVCEKLITRHTHVFGQDAAAGADSALSVWEKNKMKEKHQNTFADAVNDVPEVFPALLRAQKIMKRMKKGGWDVGSDTYDRLGEAAKLFSENPRGEEAECVLGEILWAVTSLGLIAKKDCEQVLADRAKKAQREYTAFESLVLADGKDVTALSEEERVYYMQEAKKGVS